MMKKTITDNNKHETDDSDDEDYSDDEEDQEHEEDHFSKMINEVWAELCQK